jgi:hypothetical protein
MVVLLCECYLAGFLALGITCNPILFAWVFFLEALMVVGYVSILQIHFQSWRSNRLSV